MFMKFFIPVFGLLILINTLQAQTNVYNYCGLFLTNSSDTVFISGSLINNSGAALNNAGGNLFVKQDVTNNETGMTAGGGKLWTTGTALQTFYGLKPFKTHNWIVDNTSDVVLQNRVEVGNGTGGNLNFVNGKITSGDSLQDVLFNAGSNYTGYSAAKHIIGYCSKAGTTSFTFPIGNGTFKTDVDISGLVSSTVFQCKYFGVAYSSLVATLPLTSVFNKEYWTLSRTAGSSGAYITLKWNDARNVLYHAVPEVIRVGHFTGARWVSEWGYGSGNTATGTTMSRMVNSFSPFTFAFEASVLPILMSSFTASVTTDCSVNIKWAANEEISVKKYYLQKMINNNWQNVFEATPKQTGAISTYAFTDSKNNEGNNIYRIAAENINGSINYTAVKNITVNCIREKVQIYPTITADNTTVFLPKDAGEGRLFVYNSSRQAIIENLKLSAGNQPISLAKFAPGIYNFTVITNGEKANFKVIKN
jgi:hypothetical protein